MNEPKTAVFIMARQGSKRVKEKNFKYFNGSPLISYTFETAKMIGFPVYVLTDFEKIKTLADYHYPEFMTIKEPAEYAGDKHKTIESLKYMNEYAKADNIILLQPTSPLRNPDSVSGWINHFLANTAIDSGFSGFPADRFLWTKNGKLLNCRGPRTGDKKPQGYFETGSFYIFRKDVINQNHVIYGKIAIYEDAFNVDLNTEKDFMIEEFKLEKGLYYEN